MYSAKQAGIRRTETGFCHSAGAVAPAAPSPSQRRSPGVATGERPWATFLSRPGAFGLRTRNLEIIKYKTLFSPFLTRVKASYLLTSVHTQLISHSNSTISNNVWILTCWEPVVSVWQIQGQTDGFFSYHIMCQTQETIQLFGALMALSLCFYCLSSKLPKRFSPPAMGSTREDEADMRVLKHHSEQFKHSHDCPASRSADENPATVTSLSWFPKYNDSKTACPFDLFCDKTPVRLSQS